MGGLLSAAHRNGVLARVTHRAGCRSEGRRVCIADGLKELVWVAPIHGRGHAAPLLDSGCRLDDGGGARYEQHQHGPSNEEKEGEKSIRRHWGGVMASHRRL